MEARVCVGGAGAGAEPTPPALTHSAPQPGRSVRRLLCCSAPTAPGSPHPPRLSYHRRRPEPAGTPPPGFPAQTRRPVPPGPPAGCRGYNGAAGRRDLTFHGGRGGRPPPRPAGFLPAPSPASRGRGGRRGSGRCFPGRRRRDLASPARPAPAPPPQMSPGAPGQRRRDGGGGRPPGPPLPVAPKQ